MSNHPGDNPKDRFLAFILGFGGFLLFGVALLVVGLIAAPRSLPDPAGEARLALRQEVDRAQAEQLEQLGLADFSLVAEDLAGALAQRAPRPSAVPVPGTAAAAAAMEEAASAGGDDAGEAGVEAPEGTPADEDGAAEGE